MILSGAMDIVELKTKRSAFWAHKLISPTKLHQKITKSRKIKNMGIFEHIKLSYCLGFSILRGYLKNCKNGCGKTFATFTIYFETLGHFWAPNLKIRLRKSLGFDDFSEMSPRSKGHNFHATEQVFKSRHSRHINGFWESAQIMLETC